jgi:polysaccharide deacetylase 2 family uncharacterized protein YibQ
MFSKRRIAVAAAPQGPGALLQLVKPQMAAAVANPYLSAGGAFVLFLLTASVLIATLGDASAGTPSIRLPISKAAHGLQAPPGWREALKPEVTHEAPFTFDSLILSDQPVDLTVPEMASGEAVVTLPEGGQMDMAGEPAKVMASGMGLAAAPIEGLTTSGPGGLLPTIGPGGVKPEDAYARPFTDNGKPKVALIVGGLGLNSQATRKAIDDLPPDVTLSFVPYAEGLQGWIDLARAAGHEVLLETPMEPIDYPASDPGPYTLMAAASPADTKRKLEWLLTRATGYFGLTNYLGSRFTATAGAMDNFSSLIKARGLAFVDDGSAVNHRAPGLARASADRVIDSQLSAEAIQRQLSALEAGAKTRGQALGSSFAYPLTLDVANKWARSVESRGFQLAPASALARS